MGACASKFTVLKNASTAPPPAVKYEVEPKDVNLVEEVAVVDKVDSPAEEDEAKRHQSLGHLLQEGEEKKGSTESNDKASEVVKCDDAAEVKAAVPVADGLESKCVEEVPAETVNLETTEKLEENKAVVITCTDKEPETMEAEKTEAKKPVSDEDTKKEEEKPAVATKLETCEKTPAAVENERTEEQNPASDAEKKEADEKSTEIVKIETPEKKSDVVEVTDCQKPVSEAEKKIPEEKSCEKPESPVMEKTEEQKEAANTDKNMIEEKPVENTETESSEKVEDKHVMEPQTVENHLSNKESETSIEEQKPASDTEKPKAEDEKCHNTV